MIPIFILYTAFTLVGTCIWRAHGLPDPGVPLALADAPARRP